MKFLLSILFCAALSSAFGQFDLIGAWQSTDGKYTKTVTFLPGFFSVAAYSIAEKEFAYTYGGKLAANEKTIIATIEYDTKTPANVGTEQKFNYKADKKELTLDGTTYTRVDDGTPGKLDGAWLITGRYRDNEIRRSTPGARRTMKILSGTRFQWIAYNVETKEFFGTGGGTYTTIDGKYTENIEFFSRDASRVGVSLSFDYSLPEGEWRHQGKSSKGEPLDEIWTKREKIGI